MQNWLKLLISNIVCLVIGLLIGLTINNKPETPVIINKDDKSELIDSLFNVILVKDSIYRNNINAKNDSITEHIIYIEKEYNEEVSNILSNSDSLNVLFFSNYIEHYNNK